MPATRRGRTLCFALLVGSTGCLDFFQELESEPGAQDRGLGSSSGDGDTSAGDMEACASPPGQCLDQDVLEFCPPDTAERLEYDCTAECGSLTNFACVESGAGPRCWCVDPGRQKVLSCTELEACLRDCDTAPDASCSEACFGRTDRSTVRMFGSLVNCAHLQCHDLCDASPSACPACIRTALDEGGGSCGLARSVCDTDRNDEAPFSPFG